MLIDEMIRSCAVEPVAEAAVASVGGAFAEDVRRAALARGISVGDFAVTSIESFARRGHEGDMRAVSSAMATAQAPILAGLECILTRSLDEPRRA